MKNLITTIKGKGFTLVEVLTSMAVLSVMLVIWASMFRMATNTWAEGRKKTDLNTKARLLFDMMGRDFKAGIFRSDLPAFADEQGDFDYIFYTKRESEDGDTRKISVVRYFADDDSWFYRQNAPIEWDDGWKNMSFMTNIIPAATNSKIATHDESQRVMNGVARIEFAFMTSKSDTFSDPQSYGRYADRYFSGCKTIVVTLALLDDTTVDVLGKRLHEFASSNSTKLPQLSETEASSNNVPYINGSSDISYRTLNVFDKTHKAYWDEEMNQPSFYDNYPRQLRTGLKVYERYYTISIPSDN